MRPRPSRAAAAQPAAPAPAPAPSVVTGFAVGILEGAEPGDVDRLCRAFVAAAGAAQCGGDAVLSALALTAARGLKALPDPATGVAAFSLLIEAHLAAFRAGGHLASNHPATEAGLSCARSGGSA